MVPESCRLAMRSRRLRQAARPAERLPGRTALGGRSALSIERGGPVADTTGNYVRRALDVFATYGDAEALVATDGRRFTYNDLRARIRNTAAALWGHGIRPGMTIGMLVTNSAESLFVQLAAHLLGCRTAFGMRIAPPAFLRGLLEFTEADAFV